MVDKLANGGTAADARELAKLGAAVVGLVTPYITTGWRAHVTPTTVLRMLRGADVVSQLSTLVRSPEPAVAGAGIEALGHTKSRDALEPLLECVAAGRQLEVTAEALGELGFADALAPLEHQWRQLDVDALLADVDAHSWKLLDATAIGGALLRLGNMDPEPALVRIARCTDTIAAARAVEGLRWSSESPAITAIRESMLDDRTELADTAVDAFGAIGLPAVAPVLLDVVEQNPDRKPAVWWAMRALFGDDVPDGDGAALRSWWNRNEQRWPRDRHVWWGGRDVGQAIAMLPTRDGGLARSRLELWTGVDMVDTAERGTSGDHHDMLRASLWWERVQWTWRDDVIYRNRRELAVLPILEALDG